MLNSITLNGNTPPDNEKNVIFKLEAFLANNNHCKLQTCYQFYEDDESEVYNIISFFKRKKSGILVLISFDFYDSSYFDKPKDALIFDNMDNRKIRSQNNKTNSKDIAFNTLYFLLNEYKNDFKNNTIIFRSLSNKDKNTKYYSFLKNLEVVYEFNCEQSQENIINNILRISPWLVA